MRQIVLYVRCVCDLVQIDMICDKVTVVVHEFKSNDAESAKQVAFNRAQAMQFVLRRAGVHVELRIDGIE
jgi:hypothetical protein